MENINNIIPLSPIGTQEGQSLSGGYKGTPNEKITSIHLLSNKTIHEPDVSEDTVIDTTNINKQLFITPVRTRTPFNDESTNDQTTNSVEISSTTTAGKHDAHPSKSIVVPSLLLPLPVIPRRGPAPCPSSIANGFVNNETAKDNYPSQSVLPTNVEVDSENSTSHPTVSNLSNTNPSTSLISLSSLSSTSSFTEEVNTGSSISLPPLTINTNIDHITGIISSDITTSPVVSPSSVNESLYSTNDNDISLSIPTLPFGTKTRTIYVFKRRGRGKRRRIRIPIEIPADADEATVAQYKRMAMISSLGQRSGSRNDNTDDDDYDDDDDNNDDGDDINNDNFDIN